MKSPRPDKRLNIVLFSGGRGASSIASTLAEHPQINLTIVVNTYDDGLSTGRLRAFIPGMLGPSDVRKNISTLMSTQEQCQRSLKSFLDYRLPIGTDRDSALSNLRPMVTMSSHLGDDYLANFYADLSIRQATLLSEYCRIFFGL